MPNWNYHIGFSFVVYAVLFIALSIPPTTGAIGFVILVFASLLPDFDHPKSLIRQISAIACGAGLFILVLKLSINSLSLFEGIVLSTIAGLASYFGIQKIKLKHRGKKSMHQLWVLIFVTALSALVFWFFGLGVQFSAVVFLGYSSHLFLDWVKKQIK